MVTPAKAYAQQLGFNVVFTEAYAPNTTDFSAIIDKAIASKATVLLGGGHYADGSTLARQLYGHKVPLKMLTLLVAPDSPQWVELGDAAVGVMVPSQWEPQSAFKAQYGLSGADFAKAYTAKYNTPPSYESAGGYGCGLILQRAIEQAGGIDSAKVAQALNATDVTTFYGQDQILDRCQRSRLAGRTLHGSGAMAEGQVRQTCKRGCVAPGRQEREPDVSRCTEITRPSRRSCGAASRGADAPTCRADALGQPARCRRYKKSQVTNAEGETCRASWLP